jgi:hypothetical protein
VGSYGSYGMPLANFEVVCQLLLCFEAQQDAYAGLAARAQLTLYCFICHGSGMLEPPVCLLVCLQSCTVHVAVHVTITAG